MDQGAGRRLERRRRLVDASGDDRVRAIALDRILEVDVPIIDGEREPRDEARLEHDTERLGRRLFRVERLNAAEQAVVLTCRVGRRAAASGKPGVDAAKFGRQWIGVAGARILAAVEPDELRREQLGDVRRAQCPVVRTAEADIP